MRCLFCLDKLGPSKPYNKTCPCNRSVYPVYNSFALINEKYYLHLCQLVELVNDNLTKLFYDIENPVGVHVKTAPLRKEYFPYVRKP